MSGCIALAVRAWVPLQRPTSVFKPEMRTRGSTIHRCWLQGHPADSRRTRTVGTVLFICLVCTLLFSTHIVQTCLELNVDCGSRSDGLDGKDRVNTIGGMVYVKEVLYGQASIPDTQLFCK